jgi:anthraniloyl-CoA monooxygenase
VTIVNEGEPMRIAVVGGGPGGLYLAALRKQRDPAGEVVVWERNAAEDTFGFGVVFSDETLGGIEAADPELFGQIARRFARWSDIDVVHRGRTITSGGHGFAAIDRRVLLQLLQHRCAEVGAQVRFRTVAPEVTALRSNYDLVVAADGANSAIRARYAEAFGPSVDARHSRYMWLGTDKVFSAFTFLIAETPHGPMQAHAYPFSRERSTFIVETDEDTWRRAGFDAVDAADLPPGVSDAASVARIGTLFAEHLAGARLIANNSKWGRFPVVRNATWRHGNVVLIGDAAHTAHFSIGSGTKLAMEDALSLAACLGQNPGVEAALAAYEAERRPVVESTQRAAQASLEWFEDIGQAVGQDTPQFAFNLLTRSRRVTHDNLRLRDPEFVDTVTAEFGGAPLFQPLRLAGTVLKNRIITAPIATYTATDGIPGEEEAHWLTASALGGSAVVLAGMTAVAADGRIDPRDSGLWNEAQQATWQAIVERIHRVSTGLVGLQLTHAGPKVGLSITDLTADRREHLSSQFTRAAMRADVAGFDVLELQAGHGQLLSAFLSPLTNHRADAYGGDLDGRLRFPLEVLDVVRAVWPAHKPLLVRISAVDWAEGGTTIADAVEIARAFAAHGASAIDVSSGEVVAHERPAYGRSYQTPFAERIRHAVGVPTIAVGGISTADDATSIVLAGRADLIAVGRAALHDPAWALRAAAELGYRSPAKPSNHQRWLPDQRPVLKIAR